MKCSTILLVSVALVTLAAVPIAALEINLTMERVHYLGSGRFPAGLGWADFNNDGWLDLAVGYGGDSQNRQDQIHINNSGLLSVVEWWETDRHAASTIIRVGDLDGDGLPDLVAPSSGRYSDGCPAQNQPIYMGITPPTQTHTWESQPLNAWSCALGDPDMDGDIDVAYSCGSPPTNIYQPIEIYFNDNGVMQTTSGWQSDDNYLGVAIAFADIDLDGDHDLAVGARNDGVAIFYNHNGVIETSPSWQTSAIIGGRQIAFGDVNGDGYPDLGVAAMGNTGVYGGIDPGEFSVFYNNSGILELFPSWTCTFYYEPSCVAWGDADGDGDLDLAGGSWNQVLGVFENIGGQLTDRFVWSRDGGGSPQQVAWCDWDNDGLVDDSRSFVGDGTRQLFHLEHKALHRLASVEVDGTALTTDQYCVDLREGWVSLATPPGTGESILIAFTYSTDLDLASAQTSVDFYENTDWEYTPTTDIKILVIADEEQGSNWDINDPTLNIEEHFQSYGWDITYAGLSDSLIPCDYGSYFAGCPTIATDTLLSQITDITQFDIVTVAPGTTFANILADQHTLDLLTEAAEDGVVVSGWCRGVRVLAAADVIDGLTVTGHADYEAEYIAAGATFLELAPPIIVGNIVTGVRSRYYRTNICEAIRSALPPRIKDVQQYPTGPSELESVLVTAMVMDYEPLGSVELHVDTGTGFYAVPMYDDGAHQDGAANDSLFAGAIPAVSDGTSVSYYLAATDMFPGAVRENPKYASRDAIYHTYMATGCCSQRVGDVNLAGGDEPTIGDVTTLIDMLFIVGDPSLLPCLAESDINQSGGETPVPADITIGDVSYLIDYLFIAGPESATLKECF